MRSLRYLNAVLTLIAVLLALHLWTLWQVGPAQNLSLATVASAAPRPGGIANASDQRKQMTDLLKRLNLRLDELVDLFKTGKARVKADMPKTRKVTKVNTR